MRFVTSKWFMSRRLFKPVGGSSQEQCTVTAFVDFLADLKSQLLFKIFDETIFLNRKVTIVKNFFKVQIFILRGLHKFEKNPPLKKESIVFFKFLSCTWFFKSLSHEIELWTWFLQLSQAVKSMFEIDRKSSSKIKFINQFRKIHMYFKKSRTDI